MGVVAVMSVASYRVGRNVVVVVVMVVGDRLYSKQDVRRAVM